MYFVTSLLQEAHVVHLKLRHETAHGCDQQRLFAPAHFFPSSFGGSHLRQNLSSPLKSSVCCTAVSCPSATPSVFSFMKRIFGVMKMSFKSRKIE